MLLKLTLGAAAIATVAYVAPVSAAPLPTQTLLAEEGVLQQVSDDDYRWRRRRHDDDRYRRRHDDYGHHQRHCRRVCHGQMHWSAWRGWHCDGHWHVRCHHHHDY